MSAFFFFSCFGYIEIPTLCSGACRKRRWPGKPFFLASTSQASVLHQGVLAHPQQLFTTTFCILLFFCFLVANVHLSQFGKIVFNNNKERFERTSGPETLSKKIVLIDKNDLFNRMMWIRFY